MRRGLALLLVLFASAAASGGEIAGIRAQPRVRVGMRETRWFLGEEREPMPVAFVTMNSGTFTYEIRHDQKYRRGQIGLSVPSRANWRQDGMFNILINGERFDLLPEHDEIIKIEEGATGRAMFSWENETAKVELNFHLPALDDKLFMEAVVEPKTEMESLAFSFSNSTGGSSHEREHVLYTPERRVERRGWHRINLPDENWLLLTDDLLDCATDEKSHGPSAVAFVPDGFTGGRVYIGGFYANVELECRPGARRFLFALWEFPETGNREAAEAMEKHAADAAGKMEILMEER